MASATDGRHIPRDPIIAYDDQGHPIFGYNSEGKAVCFSRKTGRSWERCMSTFRHPNGRCIKHGGYSASGEDHYNFKLGLFSKHFKGSQLVDLIEAASDPNYTGLREEIALNMIRVAKLVSSMDLGTDEQTWIKIARNASILEELLFSKGVGEFLQKHGVEYSSVARASDVAEELVRLIKVGRDERRVLKELDEALLNRAKLIEIENKRLMSERNNMPADEVLRLFSAVVGIVKTTWAGDTVGLEAFARQLDQMSGLPGTHNKALAGKQGVEGMVLPQSKFVDSVRRYKEDVDRMKKSPLVPRKSLTVARANGDEVIDADFEENDFELPIEDPEAPEPETLDAVDMFNNRKRK